jgi:hypothetical protein
VTYFPHFLSRVIFGGMLLTLLAPRGPVAALADAVGLNGRTLLSDPHAFRSVLVGTSILKEFGWTAIIYLAALTAIDPALYEAARVDGANRWRQPRYITLPSLRDHGPRLCPRSWAHPRCRLRASLLAVQPGGLCGLRAIAPGVAWPRLLHRHRRNRAGLQRRHYPGVFARPRPAIATSGLFYAVAHWNEFFRGIFYINDPTKWSLQVLLRGVVIQSDLNQIGATNRTMYGSPVGASRC